MKMIGLKIYFTTFKFNLYQHILVRWDKMYTWFQKKNEALWCRLYERSNKIYAHRERLFMIEADKHLKLEDFDSFDEVR